MALSQVAAGFKVSIIAQDPARAPYVRDGVQIYPTGVFGRMNWRRMWLPRRMGKMAGRLGADVYQVHTVELLGMAKQLKQRNPHAKVIYDMHEDYVGNVLYADYYAGWTRAGLVRRIKAVQDDFIHWGDGLILAEDCFAGIVEFDPDRTQIVRNKFQAPRDVPQPKLQLKEPGLPMMLHTGTIAENWGVLRAMHLWIQLNTYQPLNLVIAGHTQDHKVVAKLHQIAELAGLQGRFCLVGGREYVPFEDIVALIKACTFGTALYELKRNIQDRIPTKFYEFMACNKPLVFTDNAAWNTLNAEVPFGKSMSWPPRELDIAILLEWMGTHEPPFPSAPQAAWSWADEATSMHALLHKLTA